MRKIGEEAAAAKRNRPIDPNEARRALEASEALKRLDEKTKPNGNDPIREALRTQPPPRYGRAGTQDLTPVIEYKFLY